MARKRNEEAAVSVTIEHRVTISFSTEEVERILVKAAREELRSRVGDIELPAVEKAIVTYTTPDGFGAPSVGVTMQLDDGSLRPVPPAVGQPEEEAALLLVLNEETAKRMF